MQGISVQSLAAARQRLDELSLQDVAGVANELFAVVDLLDREPVLRRPLADASAPEEARVGLLDSVLGAQVSPDTLEVLHTVVAQRWARTEDLLEAIENLARHIVLSRAEQEGSLDEVEDELFRFGRILSDNQQLSTLLADRSTPVQRRRELLDSLIERKVHPASRQLLERALSATVSTTTRSLDRALEELSEQAAARHGRIIARVRAASALTPDQEQRLASALGRIYGRDVAIHSEIDPSVIGGLAIQVGNDVIDGTILHNLDEAARGLIG